MKTPQKGTSEFADLVEEPLRRIEAHVKSIALERLEHMSVRLDKLEQELDEFLAEPSGVATGV